ncbi:AAA family ATPase [Mycolicibacterium grossiae]|uniref:AAA family ATPase n=2 Tax=Mycolicibacterium grossiae TaxID=1552759 RepID=UPI0011F227A5|nr:ATP-binding protein [Mycolicibacterium grossiae]QEM47667.1 AAA family ATPase [Mycolicibacterium grossiae]
MKLHRLVLRNYRGIAHREVEFPDRGVVVVSGANEIGKSSMVEALDLLLEAKDRSSKKEVKQVKPTHVDAGAEVTAEISTGPYRFTYFKRYHKRPVTELTVTAPAREQWTGDEAHERVRVILAETVDVRLWEAQRVLQASATVPVDLSGCDALSRALDVAAGQSVTLSGTEPLLVDRIEEEFREYFTAGGKPTGPWLAAVKRRAAAAEAVERCAAEVAEVESAVARHAALTEELAEVTIERSAATRALAAATQAADEVAKVAERLAQARIVARAARDTHVAAVDALAERRRYAAELDGAGAAIDDLETAAHEADCDAVAAQRSHDETVVAATAAVDTVTARQADLDAARSAVEVAARHADAERLAARLAKIDAADRGLRDADAHLAEIRLTERGMRLIERAGIEVEAAEAAADAASARVEVTAQRAVEVTVDGQVVALAEGATWSTSATAATGIDVPGVLSVRIVPGAPAADTGAQLAAKRAALATLLADAGVESISAATELDEHRRDHAALRQRLQATRDALLADAEHGDVATLRRRLTDLRAGLTAGPVPDADAARAALQDATSSHAAAVAECARLRDAVAAASATLTERTAAATHLRANLDAARARVTEVAERLERVRAQVSDDDLVARVHATDRDATVTRDALAGLEAEFAEAAPEAVRAAVDAAAARDRDCRRRHDELSRQLVATTAQLEVYGSEGRHGRLDAALGEQAHAEAEHGRLQRRANAVHTLRTVMTRHRDDARQRYVDPFRTEVERLGRIVFGPDFEVEIDAGLCITYRTLDGCTVPYDSLSGGAKEQLGIVARLAGAALVAKEDGVPVVIDDALGFTDAARLTRMAEVFDAVGGDGQVIVLTCSPDRYADIVGAHRIALTA